MKTITLFCWLYHKKEHIKICQYTRNSKKMICLKCQREWFSWAPSDNYFW